MTIATQSDYLATNNIHGKPISARMLRTVHMGLAAMEKYRQKSDWKDALWVVNVATSVAGHIACIPVAMIEIAITSQIALIGLTINYLIFSNKNEFLQKRTLMVLSSFCHSFTMLYMSVRVMGQRPPAYIAVAAIDNIYWIGSAFFTQTVFGSCIVQSARRTQKDTQQRSVNVLMEAFPDVLMDFLEQARSDFNIQISGPTISVRAYFQQNPDDLNRIRNINFRRMRTDEAYQAQFADLVLRFLNAMGIGTVGATEIDMSVHSEEEKTYQNYISKMFKNTLIDIYNNRSQMWDNNEETGKKRIGERDPFIYMALINYVQYKELLSDIECPAHFAKLPQYNGRRERLLALKTRVEQLKDSDKELLMTKFFTEPPVSGSELRDIYDQIKDLAENIHRGKLMTKIKLPIKYVINPSLWNDGQDHFEYPNILQKAYEDALKEVGHPS